MKQPDFSIITPSYNMLDHLKKCVSSVGDQTGVSVQHVVMDGGSDDGTREWLATQPALYAVVEQDKGMYDALNKGFARSRGNIVGHLNADEQYLPGVLEQVKNWFDQHPDMDFVTGNFLVVDAAGGLLAYRRVFRPKWVYFFSNYLYTMTCTTFYREKVVKAVKFDTSYRSVADMIYVYNVLKQGFKGGHMDIFVATFTDTGANLSLSAISGKERLRFLPSLPGWYRLLIPLFRLLFYGERFLKGTYKTLESVRYSIYKHPDDTQRTETVVVRPSIRWSFGKA